jgi:hypothetical protein
LDIKGLRTLTLAGTILFGLFNVLAPLVIAVVYIPLLMFGFEESSDIFSICIVILICWAIVMIFLTYMLYKNTVLGLDRGDFVTAKRWMLIGAICGFIFGGTSGLGIVTLIIFIIAYTSTDEAVRALYYPQIMYYQPPPYPYGPNPPQQSPYPTGSRMYLPNNIGSKNVTVKNQCPRCGNRIDRSWIYCRYCNVRLQ